VIRAATSRAHRAQRTCLVLLSQLVLLSRLGAQAPNERWRTISTEHFRVSFPRDLESLARRAGGEAERAWTRLAAELSPPRGPVDLVLADNQDFSNGQATYFPTNRIVIWAHPPVSDATLRFGDDWLQQVITHELTHVFHLDRTRGLWRVAQAVFGRHPSLFPNARAPRWLTEGIAVAYESQLGSGGRLNGSELYATLDAVAGSGRPLTPGRLSLATPYWPDGDLAYFAGAWLVAESERAAGDSSIRHFIERTASFPIPYLWDVHARAAFGASFGTLARAAASARLEPVADPVPPVSGPFWEAHAPRWRGDHVFFTASDPRDVPGLYDAHAGVVERVARRNSVDAFAFAGERVVYAQLDFTDPYRFYSALYIDQRRLDHTERLASPDARADGAIVAVETANGGARLVFLGANASAPRAVGDQNPDVQWSAPRWSRQGDRIAAIRWRRGGESDVVVLDTLGRVLASFGAARAVQTHPSWDVDDRAIYFTSDRSGRSAVYRVRMGGAVPGNVEQVARDPLGVYDAEVSPDGNRLAAFRLTPDGPRLVILPSSGAPIDAAPLTATFPPGKRDTIVRATGAVHGYSPLRTLIPRYWVPTLGTSSRDNYRAGFHTSGTDVVGRYALSLDGSWDVKSGDLYGDGALTYRGFGRPVIDVGYSQGWSLFDVRTDSQVSVGEVVRRNRTAALTLGWSRPRVRQGFSVAAGTELEWRDFRASPESLSLKLDPPLPTSTLKYPALLVAAAWSTASRSALAIGPEDGISASVTARRRWRVSDPDGTRAHSVLATARLFKSLPLGGHARHAIALRGAVGWADSNITSLFAVGGVSGTSLELLPGYRIGDAQRSFFVRGFPSGAVQGTRAWGATAEYRAPLTRIARGLWPLPFYWQRSALAVFGDAGSAWCPALSHATQVCPAGGTPHTVLASAGAELLFDATLDYDEPTRFRVGIARPVRGRAAAGARAVTAYLSLGLPF
jgi:hypothetical protein